MQLANQNQIRQSLVKSANKQYAQNMQEKLMIMKDIASKRIDEEDEAERSVLKKKYYKSALP